MIDSDVLERNKALNDKLASVASTFTRRRVVDTLLAIVICLLIGVIVILLIFNYRLEEKIDKATLHQTQLICLHIENNKLYSDCKSVGLPKLVGG